MENMLAGLIPQSTGAQQWTTVCSKFINNSGYGIKYHRKNLIFLSQKMTEYQTYLYEIGIYQRFIFRHLKTELYKKILTGYINKKKTGRKTEIYYDYFLSFCRSHIRIKTFAKYVNPLHKQTVC
jgi:hypothetical protein